MSDAAYIFIICLDTITGFGGLFLIASRRLHLWQNKHIKPVILIYTFNTSIVFGSLGALATSQRHISKFANIDATLFPFPIWIMKDLSFFLMCLTLLIGIVVLGREIAEYKKKQEEIREEVEPRIKEIIDKKGI